MPPTSSGGYRAWFARARPSPPPASEKGTAVTSTDGPVRHRRIEATPPRRRVRGPPRRAGAAGRSAPAARRRPSSAGLLAEHKVLVVPDQHLSPGRAGGGGPAVRHAHPGPPGDAADRPGAPGGARDRRDALAHRPALPGRVGERHLAHRRVVHAGPAARLAAGRRGDPARRWRHGLRRPPGRLRRAQRAGARADRRARGRARRRGRVRRAPPRAPEGGVGPADGSPCWNRSCTRWCGCTPTPGGGACS